MTEKLAALATDLRTHGYVASYEHPGYLLVVQQTPSGPREYNFGFANGPLGWDRCPLDRPGEVDASDESDLTEDSSTASMFEYIQAVIHAH
jgi:hypothetical protein